MSVDAPPLADAPPPAGKASSYDVVPYVDHSVSVAHPGRMAAVGRLFGLEPPPVETARVLELGCAAGANLLALANVYPDATFLGLDLSRVQIDAGAAVAAQLGLTNLELRYQDLAEFTPEEPFDYILCHGVFSWVPDAVRARILEIVRESLSPQGIAYVSYNALPGWHSGGMAREMMLYHLEGQADAADPKSRLEHAWGILKFMAENVPPRAESHRAVLNAFHKVFEENADSYLFHDFLEDENRPFYFHEFASLLAEHDLAYLGEPEGDSLVGLDVSPEIKRTLAALSDDPLRREQYGDFLRCRNFRRSLIVRGEAAIDRESPASRIDDLFVLCPLREVPAEAAGDDVPAPGVRRFATPDGDRAVDTPDPALAAALTRLAERWPAAIPVGALVREAVQEAGGDAEDLRNGISTLFGQSLLKLFSAPPPLASVLSERPVGDPLARLRAAHGREQVTSRLHVEIRLPDLARWVLPRLDGTRDAAALVEELAEGAVRGEPALQYEGQPVADLALARRLLEPQIASTLDCLRTLGLLAA
ncbi:methyltransferase regulatory domain-containing protein [Alienimonas californiensis]|uniref:Trans-aconitate 2-methyltransferase n=1 Tax=Alienimonas californiensis TaxID=2527989 RepID=A0A517P589_9PLAN|nr:class I SAM-dependent methyltransferase [Alienimonas californiensis]QDT14515.1 trans-aconitate 2-methyltransferase [Alienimonas californiensis]